MPRDMSNAGQSPSDVARTPSGVARDVVLGRPDDIEKHGPDRRPPPAASIHVRNQKISMEIDAIAIKIKEITAEID